MMIKEYKTTTICLFSDVIASVNQNPSYIIKTFSFSIFL